MTRRPLDWAVALGVLVMAGAIAMTVARPAMPPFMPFGDYAGYSAGAPRALALVEPVAHAPWTGTALVPWSVVAAAAVLASLWAASRRAGATPAAAALVLAAVVSRPELRVPLALGAEAVIGVALVWGSALALMSGLPRARAVVWSAALAAAAVAYWPPLLAAMPILAALAAADGVAASIVVLFAAVAGAVGGAALWAARAAALANEPVSILEALSVIASAEPRGHDPFVWPAITAPALPAALALLGALAACGHVAARRRVTLALAGLVPLAALVGLPAWRAEILRVLAWTSWPLAAVGLTWLGARAPAGRAPWVIGLVGAVLVAGGVSASVRVVEEADARAFARALGDALHPILSAAPATVVTDDTRMDTALVAWGSSAGLQRVRPIPRLVDAVVASRRTLLAAPSARKALELWGFRFAAGVDVTAPAPFPFATVAGRLRCVPVATPWRELPGLEYTGRLGLQVPMGAGRLELVIVGPPPLVPHLTSTDGRPVGHLAPLVMELTTLPAVLWPDAGRLPDPRLSGVRVELPARSDTAQSASLTLGQRAPQVAARFVEPAHLTGVATVCAAPLPRFDPFDVAGSAAASLTLDDDAFFPGGWHIVEGSGAGLFRWTSARAITLVPSSRARDVTLSIDARPAARVDEGDVVLRATVNGTPVGDRAMTGGPQTYTWQAPAGLWVDGANEIALDVSRTTRPSDSGSHDTRELGVAVGAIRLRR